MVNDLHVRFHHPCENSTDDIREAFLETMGAILEEECVKPQHCTLKNVEIFCGERSKRQLVGSPIGRQLRRLRSKRSVNPEDARIRFTTDVVLVSAEGLPLETSPSEDEQYEMEEALNDIFYNITDRLDEQERIGLRLNGSDVGEVENLVEVTLPRFPANCSETEFHDKPENEEEETDFGICGKKKPAVLMIIHCKI